jgi:xanthine dehydrogenase small subunit
MIHGKQLITIENLKSPDGKLHPVQQALVDSHGSQCGFCTPGIIMSLFALYKNEQKPDRDTIDNALMGNLCRCTGYTPIIEAAKNVCRKKRKDHFSANEEKIIHLLRRIKSERLVLTHNNQKYFRPVSIKDALQLRRKNPDAVSIAGATDIALRVTKNHETFVKVIDLSSISKLSGIKHNKNDTKIMAGTTLAMIRSYAKNIFPALYDTLNVFGSEQIRNLATIGGNLATASPIGDIAPVLMAYESSIILVGQKKNRKLAIEDFITGYRKTACGRSELISAIMIPHPKKNLKIRFYKFSKRRDLDISTVSGGFRLELTKKNRIKSIKLAYGGLAQMTKRALKTEKFLMRKEWNEDVVLKAGQILQKEFKPISDARAGAEGRMIAAKNLLLKFWTDTK